MPGAKVPTRLLFVRHGKQQSTSQRSPADRKDPPLSEEGHQQAVTPAHAIHSRWARLKAGVSY